MDSENDSCHSENEFYYPEFWKWLQGKFNIKTAYKVLYGKKNTWFAGLGRSVLGKTVPSVLSTALGQLKTSGTVFPNTDLPAGK